MNATVETPITAGDISVDIELDHVHQSVNSNPDKIRLVLRPHLIAQIAKIQAGLLAMDLGYSEVTIPLPDDLQMFEDGEEWIEEEKDPATGDFNASSTWLHVQHNTLSVEIWDEHGDDELHGNVLISSIPGLTEALLAAKEQAHKDLIARLS
ncbi:hypothetical protein [Methylibium petroleiphilum]|nr:hypothetical protein [Methylibium petroleiphilum]